MATAVLSRLCPQAQAATEAHLATLVRFGPGRLTATVADAWSSAPRGSILAFENAERLAELGIDAELFSPLLESCAGRTIAFCSRRPLSIRFRRFMPHERIVTLYPGDLAFNRAISRWLWARMETTPNCASASPSSHGAGRWR